MSKKTFYDNFIEKLDEIESRAKNIGSTITEVCRDANIARATPDRWRSKAPKSIDLMVKLEKAVEAAEQKAAASNQ